MRATAPKAHPGDPSAEESILPPTVVRHRHARSNQFSDFARQFSALGIPTLNEPSFWQNLFREKAQKKRSFHPSNGWHQYRPGDLPPSHDPSH